MEIRRPRDVEGPVCRLLLPDAAPDARKREFFVAAADTVPPILGAVSFRIGEEVLYGVQVHVVRGRRREKIGSRLLGHVIEYARSNRFRGIIANADSKATPEAEPFLAAQGFTRSARLTTVEADSVELYRSLIAVRERLIATGKVPKEVRVVPYSEAPKDEVARLSAEYIVNNPHVQPEVIRQAMNEEQIGCSPVLMVDGKVEGLLLYSVDGNLGTVYANVITPRFRGYWANPLLMATAMEEGYRRGARRVRFEIAEGNRDTWKVATLLHAEAVKILDRFILTLTVGT